MKNLGRYVSKKQAPRLNVSPISAFAVSGIIAMGIILCCFLFSHGDLIPQYFFYDMRDTGMDFFHSIEYVRGRAPYELFDTLYPPLANLLFYVIYCFVPLDVSKQWPADFLESLRMRGTQLDLRTYQAPMLLFLLFVLLSTWIMRSLCASCLKETSNKRANLVAFCMLFSPGMLYALERGNILLLVVPLTLFFVMYRNSENRILRELALLALAAAAGLKLYPAFFGVLLIRDKKYMQAVRAVIYGILTVILPMLFFKEGLAGIPMWLSIVFDFGSGSETPWLGTAFVNILHRIGLYANRYLGITIGTSWFSAAGMIASAVLLLASLGCKKEWQSVLAATMAVIMFQSQSNYIFGFVCVPMVLFLVQEKRFTKDNIAPFLLMLLLTVNLPLFHTEGVHYPDVALRQLISLLLVCWCVINTAVASIKKFKSKE